MSQRHQSKNIKKISLVNISLIFRFNYYIYIKPQNSSMIQKNSEPKDFIKPNKSQSSSIHSSNHKSSSSSMQKESNESSSSREVHHSYSQPSAESSSSSQRSEEHSQQSQLQDNHHFRNQSSKLSRKQSNSSKEGKKKSLSLSHSDSQSKIQLQFRQDIRYPTCFRCGKKGHSIKTCTSFHELKRCINCLKKHSTNSCGQRVCFICNQQGHIARFCTAPRGRCRKCSMKGHFQNDCGMIVFLNHSINKPERLFREKYSMDDLVRLYCLSNCKYPIGHFNCHKYQNQSQKLYQRAKKEEEKQSKERFLLTQLAKLRELYFKHQVVKDISEKEKKSKEQVRQYILDLVGKDFYEKSDGLIVIFEENQIQKKSIQNNCKTNKLFL